MGHPVRSAGLSTHGRDADDAVLVRQVVEPIVGLLGPAVADEPGDGDLEGGG